MRGRDLVSVDAIRNGIVERTQTPAPVELLSKASAEDTELAEYLGAKIATLPLLGKRGLKDRSSLMEFRYDPA
ncbi:ABC-three component system middle component 5 [Mesorhizobium japonicum]|uniref:ABC-three component system middle component 5 n=1 Tax=Mesorhizobium TaxID=68287 RepID=UPI003CC7E532